MKIKAVSEIMLTLLLTSMLTLAFKIELISAGQYPAIYIDPATILDPTLTPGGRFTISIKTDYYGSDVWGWIFTLTYNPNVLHGGIGRTDTWTGDNVTTVFSTTGTPVVQNSEEVYVNKTLMTRITERTDIWTGDNETRTFITAQPVLPDSETVLVDRMPPSWWCLDYTIDYSTGNITFDPAPEMDKEIKVVYDIWGDYTIDYSTGTIQFVTPPSDGVEIKVAYLYGGVTNGDLITKDKDPSAWFFVGTFNNAIGKLSYTSAFFLDIIKPIFVTSGPGTLANVTFTVVGKGISNITLGPETALKNPIPGDPPIVDHTQHGYFDNRALTAVVDVHPNALNLHSMGKWITAYIQLPAEYDAEDIDATTVLLNETIQPVLDPKYEFVTNSSEYLVDNNEDGILEHMVKFNRTEVVSWICNDLGIQYGNVTLTITGKLFDGAPFEGIDIIKVLFPGDVDDDGDVDCNDLYMLSRCHGMNIENPSYYPLADFNEDGYINSKDLLIVSENYGKTA